MAFHTINVLKLMPSLRGKTFVELEGVEPSSKQGNHTLSTRLFQTLVFVPQQDLDHQLRPYPLNLIMPAGHNMTIPDLPAPLDPRIRNNTLGATSRPVTW